MEARISDAIIQNEAEYMHENEAGTRAGVAKYDPNWVGSAIWDLLIKNGAKGRCGQI